MSEGVKIIPVEQRGVGEFDSSMPPTAQNAKVFRAEKQGEVFEYKEQPKDVEAVIKKDNEYTVDTPTCAF